MCAVRASSHSILPKSVLPRHHDGAASHGRCKLATMPPRKAHLELLRHQDVLAHCRRCPRMQSTPVIGNPVLSRVLLVGQAPGPKEPAIGKPFAWTAGKQLFKWFGQIGLDEEAFRGKVYMAAVCRCFPGKRPTGGDRVPDPDEVANCSRWLDAEFAILKPKLVIP